MLFLLFEFYGKLIYFTPCIISYRDTLKSDNTTQCGPSKSSLSLSNIADEMERKLNLNNFEIPKDVDDFDKENWDDIFQVSHYAMDIFTYLKSREVSNW